MKKPSDVPLRGRGIFRGDGQMQMSSAFGSPVAECGGVPLNAGDCKPMSFSLVWLASSTLIDRARFLVIGPWVLVSAICCCFAADEDDEDEEDDDEEETVF